MQPLFTTEKPPQIPPTIQKVPFIKNPHLSINQNIGDEAHIRPHFRLLLGRQPGAERHALVGRELDDGLQLGDHEGAALYEGNTSRWGHELRVPTHFHFKWEVAHLWGKKIYIYKLTRRISYRLWALSIYTFRAFCAQTVVCFYTKRAVRHKCGVGKIQKKEVSFPSFKMDRTAHRN